MAVGRENQGYKKDKKEKPRRLSKIEEIDYRWSQ